MPFTGNLEITVQLNHCLVYRLAFIFISRILFSLFISSPSLTSHKERIYTNFLMPNPGTLPVLVCRNLVVYSRST